MFRLMLIVFLLPSAGCVMSSASHAETKLGPHLFFGVGSGASMRVFGPQLTGQQAYLRDDSDPQYDEFELLKEGEATGVSHGDGPGNVALGASSNIATTALLVAGLRRSNSDQSVKVNSAGGSSTTGPLSSQSNPSTTNNLHNEPGAVNSTSTSRADPRATSNANPTAVAQQTQDQAQRQGQRQTSRNRNDNVNQNVVVPGP